MRKIEKEVEKKKVADLSLFFHLQSQISHLYSLKNARKSCWYVEDEKLRLRAKREALKCNIAVVRGNGKVVIPPEFLGEFRFSIDRYNLKLEPIHLYLCLSYKNSWYL